MTKADAFFLPPLTGAPAGFLVTAIAARPAASRADGVRCRVGCAGIWSAPSQLASVAGSWRRAQASAPSQQLELPNKRHPWMPPLTQHPAALSRLVSGASEPTAMPQLTGVAAKPNAVSTQLTRPLCFKPAACRQPSLKHSRRQHKQLASAPSLQPRKFHKPVSFVCGAIALHRQTAAPGLTGVTQPSPPPQAGPFWKRKRR